MTEHIPTPLDTRRLVTKYEELRRKREGAWDPTTMVSETTPEGAALRAHRASPDKVADAQQIATEPLKNETPPKFKTACKLTTEQPRGDDEDDAGLVEIPAGDHSPPHEPTSLPTAVTTTVANGTTKAEAATSEAEGPKTETTPLAAMGRQRSRSGGRQLKKQKLPAEISALGRKRSPARLRLFLDSVAEYPVKSHASKKAGVHRRTPDYWLKRSAAGDAGYDLEWRGDTAKFHEHFISAMEEGSDKVLEVAFRVATGYDEILTNQDGVIYDIDPALWSLGLRGPDAYQKDENGNFVPQTVRKVDPKMIRWLLERLLPDKYGKDWTIDDTHEGGVLVVGGPSKTEKLEKELGGEQQIQDVEFDDDDGSEGEK